MDPFPLQCNRCPICINPNDRQHVTCRVCSKPYHYLCAAINSDQLRALSISDRVLWLCDKCLDSFDNWKKEHLEPPLCDTKSTKQQIAELQDQVSGILNTLAGITSKVSNSQSQIPLPSQEPTTIHSSTLLDGSNSSAKCFGESGQCNTSSGGDNERFSLLLTNINRSVSENDISVMVAQCLEASTEELQFVKKLVPKWVDCNTLDYISFKIVLHEKFKARALCASTWPKEIKFREFVNRLNSTWMP